MKHQTALNWMYSTRSCPNTGIYSVSPIILAASASYSHLSMKIARKSLTKPKHTTYRIILFKHNFDHVTSLLRKQHPSPSNPSFLESMAYSSAVLLSSNPLLLSKTLQITSILLSTAPYIKIFWNFRIRYVSNLCSFLPSLLQRSAQNLCLPLGSFWTISSISDPPNSRCSVMLCTPLFLSVRYYFVWAIVMLCISWASLELPFDLFL